MDRKRGRDQNKRGIDNELKRERGARSQRLPTRKRRNKFIIFSFVGDGGSLAPANYSKRIFSERQFFWLQIVLYFHSFTRKISRWECRKQCDQIWWNFVILAKISNCFWQFFKSFFNIWQYFEPIWAKNAMGYVSLL